MIGQEQATIGAAGPGVARAAARMLAIEARKLLIDAESILAVAGQSDAAAVAHEAGEATTRLLHETYDGPSQVFACKR